MSILRTIRNAVGKEDASTTGMRNQYAALCFRRKKNGVEVLLISSRDSARWIIPKGWPMAGKTPAEAALTEAWEEAGVKGHALDLCVGLYSYHKAMADGQSVPCVVAVFPVEVKRLSDTFPEAGQRRRKWFSPKKAAARVREPDLQLILREFTPPKLK